MRKPRSKPPVFFGREMRWDSEDGCWYGGNLILFYNGKSSWCISAQDDCSLLSQIVIPQLRACTRMYLSPMDAVRDVEGMYESLIDELESEAEEARSGAWDG